jgi:hypothetical protein
MKVVARDVMDQLRAELHWRNASVSMQRRTLYLRPVGIESGKGVSFIAIRMVLMIYSPFFSDNT